VLREVTVDAEEKMHKGEDGSVLLALFTFTIWQVRLWFPKSHHHSVGSYFHHLLNMLPVFWWLPKTLISLEADIAKYSHLVECFTGAAQTNHWRDFNWK
jgi:hypothetical protein